MLAEACQKKGMQVQNTAPKIRYVGDIAPSEVGKALYNCPSADNEALLTYTVIFQELEGKLPQLVVCFLPSRTDLRYNMIKRLGDCLQGFATQCMVIEKAIKRDPSYFQNVALKINLKLGGISASVLWTSI